MLPLHEVSALDELPDEVAEYDLVDEDQLDTDALTDLVLYTLDWSVQSLLERIGTTFDVNPSFQRRDAWNAERKSLYIESLILGLPVPQVVLAEDPAHKGRFIVLDGKQRLVTIKQFAAPDAHFKSFKLRRLEFIDNLAGMTFADLNASPATAEYAENFLAQPIRTIVVRNWRDPAVLYQIFVRLNQGSLSLSPQELRQGLYPNEFTRWINSRSAESELIHRARRIPREDFRMRDAEMLLRYVAFLEGLEEYRGNLRKFLDDACVRGGKYWGQLGEAHYEDLARRCEASIERTFKVFGEANAFLRYERGSYNRRFNVAVFDLMTAVLGDTSISDQEILDYADPIRLSFERLCEQDQKFQDALQTTTKSIPSTGGRLLTFGTAVAEIVGHPVEAVARAEGLLGRDSG